MKCALRFFVLFGAFTTAAGPAFAGQTPSEIISTSELLASSVGRYVLDRDQDNRCPEKIQITSDQSNLRVQAEGAPQAKPFDRVNLRHTRVPDSFRTAKDYRARREGSSILNETRQCSGWFYRCSAWSIYESITIQTDAVIVTMPEHPLVGRADKFPAGASCRYVRI